MDCEWDLILAPNDQKGHFHIFCQEYFPEGLPLFPDNIHTMDYDEPTLDRADFITALVHQLTSQKNSVIHLCLAGCDEAVSFHSGFALSLYGRKQDQLSRLMVIQTLQIESCPGMAKVNLTDIPFIRMGREIPGSLKKGRGIFSEHLSMIQRLSEPVTVEINVATRQVRLNSIIIPMDKADLSVYLWLCLRRLNNEPPLLSDAAPFVEEYIKVYAVIVGPLSGMLDRVRTVACKRTPKQQRNWLQQRISRLKSAIVRKLGGQAAQPFLVHPVKYRGKTAYQTRFDKSAINLSGMADE